MRTRIMSNDNPVNALFMRGLLPEREDDGWRREMVEMDVDVECDGRLDLVSVTEYSS